MTLSSVGSPHKASQSGYGGGQGIAGRASSLNQGGAGETSLRDGSAAIDNRFEKTHSADRVESSPLKIKLIPGSYGKSTY